MRGCEGWRCDGAASSHRSHRRTRYVLIRRVRREVRHAPRSAGQLEDVHAGVRTVNDVDVAAIVDFDVIGLNGDLATFVSAPAYTPLVGLRGHRRNVVADLLRVERIADVDRTHARVEPRDEDDAPVVDR